MHALAQRVIQIKQWLIRQPIIVLLVGGGAIVALMTVAVFAVYSVGHHQAAPSDHASGSSQYTPSKSDRSSTTPSPARSTTTPLPVPAPPPLTPATLLNLTNWRLTLPVDTPHKGFPDEINQPELANFTAPPYFDLTPAKDGVVFQANADGATTKNSGYPRSELREMSANGATEASWSNAAGTHTMVVREAITHLPVVKPEVVAAQIHDASDDVIMVKLSGKHLFVEGSSKALGDLDTNYAPGTPYTLKIVASNGRIQVYFNGVLKVDYAKSGSGYYFKTGCYTQSNVGKGDAAGAYAQVIIYGIEVSHT